MPRRRWITLLLPLLVAAALLAVLVLVPARGERPAPPEATATPAGETETPPPVAKEPEPARLEGTKAGAAAPAAAAGVTIRGMVANGEGALLAGVPVRLRIAGAVADETVTDAQGRFEVGADLPPGEGVLYGIVEARDPQAGAALRLLALRADPAWGDRRVPPQQAIGRLVLQPVHPFDVRVVSTCDAAPPATIRVRHGVFHGGPDFLVAGTDAHGALHVDGFTAGPWRLIATAPGCGRGSTFFKLPLAEDGPVEVEIAPPRDVVVQVVDGLTDEPVAGATLDASEILRRPDGNEFVPYVPPLAIPPTDEHGRTVIAGLGEQDELRLVARAAGYPPPADQRIRFDAPGTAKVEAGATEVRVELVGERTVTWPIEAGEAPVPPDGTEVRIEELPGSRHATPSSGRVVDGKLVVPGWGAGYAAGRAVTPDGAVARLLAGPEETTGAPISFHHLRTLEVRLAYPDGAPVAGFYVVATNAGAAVLGRPLATDEHGVVRIGDLSGQGLGRVDVRVSDKPEIYGGFPIGTVDLTQGDATLEHVVPRPRQVVLHVRVDGEPALPPTVYVRMGWSRYGADDLERDDSAATLRFLWRPYVVGGETQVEVSAPGMLPGTTTVDVPSGEGAIDVTVDVRHGGSLVAEILPPPDGRYRVHLQVWDSDTRRWLPGDSPNTNLRADEEGEMRFAPLPPGLYRVAERYTGIVSSSADVSEGTDEARVRLDLSHVATVAGRVELPEGVGPLQPFVRVLGVADFHPPESVLLRDPRQAWVGAVTAPDGTFKVRVPGDREVTLSPRAPFLRPAAGGEAVVHGGEQGVVLRLEKAPVATFRYDREPRRNVNPGQAFAVAVLLYTGEPEGDPAQRLSALVEGSTGRFSGFPTGTFTVWIDAVPFAPVVLRDVDFGEGDVDLGTLKTSDGSTFVARIVPAEGTAMPRCDVQVMRVGEPRYVRSGFSMTDPVIRVSGIGPGRFRVSVECDPTGPRLDAILPFDGSNTVERTLKP